LKYENKDLLSSRPFQLFKGSDYCNPVLTDQLQSLLALSRIYTDGQNKKT